MRWANAWTAAGLGATVTTVLSALSIGWPAANLAIGCVLTAGVLLLRRNGRKYYGRAGVLSILAVGLLIYLTPLFPPAYSEGLLPPLLAFGFLSGSVAVAKSAGQRVVALALGTVFDEETTIRIYDALASFISLLGFVWLLLTAAEKLTRYVSAPVGAGTAVALNFLGVRVPVTVPLVKQTVDIVLVVLVGCIVVGFQTLETLHTSWRAAKSTAEFGAEAEKSASSKAVDAVDRARTGDGDEEH